MQDAKAAELATYILSRNGGDVSTIPVSWYIGHVPVGAEWDTVPRPDAGNRLTPAGVPGRWLQRYAELLGNARRVRGRGARRRRCSPADTSATCRTVVVDVGAPGAPQYVLTQAQSFVVDAAGRAVPDAVDPCDPAAPSGGAAAGAGRRRCRAGADVAKLERTRRHRRPALVDAASIATGWPSCTLASEDALPAPPPALGGAGRRRRPTHLAGRRADGVDAALAGRVPAVRRRGRQGRVHATSTAIEYVDLCLGDTGAMGGHALPAVTAAVADRAAAGRTTMLPTADAAWVAGELARRFGLPAWQFALSATDANRFALRLARHATGRRRILVFDWCYHGTVDETLVVLDAAGRVVPRARLARRAASIRRRRRWSCRSTTSTRCAAALAAGDVACVLAEPALTNIGIVLPDPGFHDALRRLTRETGTLLRASTRPTRSAPGPAGTPPPTASSPTCS